jgi:Ammonium Transporter Family
VNDFVFMILATPVLVVGNLLLSCGTARSRDVAGVIGKCLIDLCSAVFSASLVMMIVGWSTNPTTAWPFVVFCSALSATSVSLASLPRVRPLAGGVASGVIGIACAVMVLGHQDVITMGMPLPVVMLGAGIAGLIAAIICQARAGKYNRDGSANVILGHSLVFQFIGVILITIAIAMSQSMLLGLGQWMLAIMAAAGATLAATLGARLAFGRTDFSTLPLAFALGMNVSVMCSTNSSWLPIVSVILALICGGVMPLLIARLDMQLRIDDPGGLSLLLVIPGLLGLVRLFTVPALGKESLIVLLSAAMMVSGVAFVYWLAKKKNLLRVEADVEAEGSDLLLHDLNAYPDFTQPMIRSYHLRQ